jgi:hypothetical protein
MQPRTSARRLKLRDAADSSLDEVLPLTMEIESPMVSRRVFSGVTGVTGGG